MQLQRQTGCAETSASTNYLNQIMSENNVTASEIVNFTAFIKAGHTSKPVQTISA